MNDLESVLMTPEEMAKLKALQEKSKAMKKALGGVKDDLFQSLTEKFAPTITKVKKDQVTVSTGEALEDGNIYAISFGSEEEVDQEVDTKKLAETIIGENLATIEQIMGISNSMKITGTFEGKSYFWQVRKRP
jgi:hypothetical protein